MTGDGPGERVIVTKRRVYRLAPDEEEAAIDRHVDRYFDLLQAELDRNPDELPASMTFPAPRDEAEKAAFQRFVRMAGQAFPTAFYLETGS
jgi:hypothetical protein